MQPVVAFPGGKMMFTESSDILFLIPFAVGVFILLARPDLYLARRRNQIANARYLQHMHATRGVSPLHWRGASTRPTRQSWPGLIIGPEVSIREPGRFSRRRVVTDLLGRTVAIHYEELRMGEHSGQAPMLLMT